MGYLYSGCCLLQDGIETLEEGTVDRVAVYPRRAIGAALHRDAAVIVFAHDHPNRHVQPSEQDKVPTRPPVLAANADQIKILDYLIVSTGQVFSYRK